MSLKKGLKDCPGCKLLVTKLAEDYDVKMNPDDIPTFMQTLNDEDSQLKQELARQRRAYTHMDAEKTKENAFLTMELYEAERQLQELSAELQKALDESQVAD